MKLDPQVRYLISLLKKHNINLSDRVFKNGQIITHPIEPELG